MIGILFSERCILYSILSMKVRLCYCCDEINAGNLSNVDNA